MPRLPRRLQMARPAKLNPEASPHRSPTVPWSPTSNEGVTSTSPRVTSASIVPSARPMRSRNSTTSSRAMKAGKLAKPSVATATPPTLTAMKKVIQCTASRKPLASTIAARAQPLQQRPALRQGQHQQCGCGEPCPAGRDGHGIETDEGTEDAGEPEKHGHPMGGRECADVRVLHDPLIVGACRRSGHPDQPCQCTRWICSVLQASCSFFTPSMKWTVLLWASTAA